MRQRIEKYLGLVIKIISKVATVAGYVKDVLDDIVDLFGAFIGVIVSAAKGLKSDIDALKAQVAAQEALDFTDLDAKVAALAALDAENPPPVVP